MTLIGTTNTGQSVNLVVVTDSNGFYSFGIANGHLQHHRNRAGWFHLRERSTGSLGGFQGSATIYSIKRECGDAGIKYDFPRYAGIEWRRLLSTLLGTENRPPRAGKILNLARPLLVPVILRG